MGMSIDDAKPILHDMYNYYNDTDIDAYIGFDKEDNNAIEIALDTMRKYQQMKADYENRLKSDMVAMLTDIQLEIQEYSGCSCSCSDGIVDDIDDVIQQKIDTLRGE